MLNFLRNLVFLAYVVVGVALAHSHNYLRDLHNADRIISAVLAIALWPLILMGINLHLDTLAR